MSKLIPGLVLLFAGCSGPAKPSSSPSAGPDRPAVETAEAGFLTRMERAADPDSIREALSRLSGRIPDKPSAEWQTSLAALRLDATDTAELLNSEYTGLDAAFLHEALLLRQIVEAIGADAGPTPERVAKIAAFVRRQVYLKPPTFPPAPAYYTLQTGHGGDFERATLFCALALQAGLETAWIGPPSAADFASFPNVRQEGDVLKPIAVPFTGLAVFADGDALLVPISLAAPPPGQAGYPTLAASRDAKVAETWTPLFGADALKALPQAKLFLAPPLSRLAPRLAAVEQLLTGTRGVKISVDWPKLVAVWSTLKGVTGEPMVWNAPDDFTNPTRGLGRFLSLANGGLSPAPGFSLSRLAVFSKASEADFRSARDLVRFGELWPFPDPSRIEPPRLAIGEQGEAANILRSQFALLQRTAGRPDDSRQAALLGRLNDAVGAANAKKKPSIP